MQNHFLGYPNHSDWLAAIDRRQPVNSISVVSSEPLVADLYLSTHFIVLSQAQENAVHIWRLKTDQYQSIDGHEPLDGKSALHEKRAESAWAIVQAWLAENGLTARRALLAVPKNIRLLEGHADGLMEYDKELGYWINTDRLATSFLGSCPSVRELPCTPSVA